MRFTPYGSFADSSLEDLGILSDDESSPFLVKSSPLKSLDQETPSKPSNVSKRLSMDAAVSQSPLGRSPYNSSRILQTQEQKNVDGLSELLQDLKLNERYQLVKEQKLHKSRVVTINSRPSSAKHTRRPSIESSPLRVADEWVKHDLEQLSQVQDSVVSNLESRLARRSKEVAAKIQAIEEDRQRREEEERRRQEEEKRRLEEEKKRLEEEEKKREEEAQKRKEEEEQKRKEQELKEQQRVQQLEEATKRAKTEAEKLAKQQAEKSAKKGQGVTDFAEVERTFVHYKKLIHEIREDVVVKVKADVQTKNLILKHKRKINPKFGQLTNSMSQLQKISSEVTILINETKGLDIAYKWILNFVAKAIVSQAETEVRAKPSSSVPLAKLTLNLMCEFPELKEYLLARFVKKCPFVIGFTCAIDTEEGRLRMGWKRSEDKRWEDEVTYDERMGGMMTLYSVLTRLPLDQKYFQGMSHPLPLSENWKMVARLLNQPLELLTNAHFIVASSWWEASAEQILMNYGRQGAKILQTLWTTWPSAVKDKKFTGSNTLRTLGEDWSISRTVKKFGEMER